MKLYFHSPAFDAQLLRLASTTYFGACDIGECLSAASRIQEGDFDSWEAEWSKLGERLMNEGFEAEQKGHYVSAKECFLKASNYHRAALFFDYRVDSLERLRKNYNAHAKLFEKASIFFKHPTEALKIPFLNYYMPGVFYSSSQSNEVRPLIICVGGYDSTYQESYFSFVPAALRRGYNVLTFDGPGQGGLLINKGIPMRPDYEVPLKAVFQFLEKRADVDFTKIALYGVSWGGYLAARGACFEKASALIANPGQFDAMENVRRALSQDNEGSSPDWEEFMQAAMKDKYFGAKIQCKMFIHGVETPNQLLQEWKNYTLKGLSEKITCPTLICDSENENLAPEQAKMVFESLKCPKDFLLFKASEGAGEHTGNGNLSLVAHRVLDWLDETFHYETDIEREPELITHDVINLGYMK